MRIYETTFIVNPQTDDATIESQIKTVSDLITNNGGKILGERHMGTRRMAYQIDNLTQGFYGSFVFEAEPTFVKTLDRLYKQEEAYIRNLTVLFEGNVEELSEEKFPIGEEAEKEEKRTERPVAQRRPEPAPAPAAEEKKPEAEAEAAPAETTETADESTKTESSEPAATDEEQEL